MRALITGVLGQDGSYLAEQLAGEGWEVFGLTRRTPTPSVATLLHGDLLDQDSLERALRVSKPDVVFNLAAVTAPGGGWGAVQPPLLCEVTAVGAVRLMDAMLATVPDAKLVHASTSAIFDHARYGLYGAAKRFAHDAVLGYRGQLHASNAVLFSHTSPRQDPRFLARRICSTIAAGGRLVLGDVDSRRDWGFSPDYCEALRLIAEQPPGDWVVATGETHSVRDMVDVALSATGLAWGDVVRIDPALPKVPDEIPGDLPSVRELGWVPRTGFAEMVDLMVKEASWHTAH